MQGANGRIAQLMWSVYLIYLDSANANEEYQKYWGLFSFGLLSEEIILSLHTSCPERDEY